MTLDFALSPEQEMLRDAVDGIAAAWSAGSVGAVPTRSERWALFAELGWPGLLVPEDRGGIGGTMEDAAVLMEGLGRGLVASPFPSTAILAAPLLARSEGPLPAGLLGRIARGEAVVALAMYEPGRGFAIRPVHGTARPDAEGWRLHGTKIAVPEGSEADHFLVPAALAERAGTPMGLFVVPKDAPGLALRSYSTIDGRPACDLMLRDVRLAPDAMVLAPGVAEEAFDWAVDRAALLLAAEALGVMSAALSLTAEYLRTRHQFGRPLSRFQVLGHRLASMYVRREGARSMVCRGLSAADADAGVRGVAVSATMVSVLQAGEFVCGQAIQLHGGIGMADESAVGQYYKRMRAIGRTHGDAAHHLRRYIRLARGSGSEGL